MARIAGWTGFEGDPGEVAATVSGMTEAQRQPRVTAAATARSVRAIMSVLDRSGEHARGARAIRIETDGGGGYVVALDGLYFNASDLESTLRQRGHRERLGSDAELTVAAYREWADEFVGHLDGYFAIALYDEVQRRLVLARDHIGARPLFYARRGSSVLFSSELKGLLAHPLVEAAVDGDGMAQILTYVRRPGSGVYRGLEEVRPACTVSISDGQLRERCYWQPRATRHEDDLGATVRRIADLVQAAATRQVDNVSSTAALLSGGLDSSLLAAIYSELARREGGALDTYSVDFGGEDEFRPDPLHLTQDEPWAREVADYLGTLHHSVTVDPTSLVRGMFAQLRGHDLPMVGQMNTSLDLLFDQIGARSVSVVSGEGADEIFAGYPWYRLASIPGGPPPTFPWLPAFLGTGENPFSWLSPQVGTAATLTDHVTQTYKRTASEAPVLDGESGVAAAARKMQYVDLKHWLPFLLERKDRAAAAAGLDVRAPFGDRELIDYAINVPEAIKGVDDIEKGVLRRAFGHRLPQEIARRPKSAYPSAYSARYDRLTREMALQVLDSPCAPVRDLVDPRAARAEVEAATTGRTGMAQVSLFERILMLNEWLKVYRPSLEVG